MLDRILSVRAQRAALVIAEAVAFPIFVAGACSAVAILQFGF